MTTTLELDESFTTPPQDGVITEEQMASFLQSVTQLDEQWWSTLAWFMMHNVVRQCWEIAEDHGFHDVGQTFGDKIALIHSEASEALEDFREGHAPNEYWLGGKDGTKPCGIPSELADIIIRVFDVAHEYGIDIASAVFDKMAYNHGREHLHGKVM